jgi:hypothetical protein
VATELVGLNQLWYAYARSDFHFINDNAEWLQMDKAGHIYSSYHLGRLGLKCSNGLLKRAIDLRFWYGICF